MTEKKLSDKCEELRKQYKYLFNDPNGHTANWKGWKLIEEITEQLDSHWQELYEIAKNIALERSDKLVAKDKEIEELKAEIEELLIYDTKSEISIKEHKQQMHSLLDEIEKHIRKESHIFRGTITVQKAVKKIEQKRKEIEGKNNE